jgi:membrane-associated phospholipid phosphatase
VRNTVTGRIARVDELLFRRLAAVPAPVLDRLVIPVGRAADHSVLWMVIAAGLAVRGDRRAARSAGQAVVAVAVTSLLANQAAKRVGFRPRPDRDLLPAQRRTPPKDLSSFPSGHAAAAAAFVVVAGHGRPRLAALLTALAAVVAFSRVFTGMHYPSDVAAGAGLGALTGAGARRATTRK